MEIKATNFIVNPRAIDDDSLYLDQSESHHLAGVFRAKQGDIFYAIDGSGKKYRAVIKSISSKKVIADIISTVRLENETVIKFCLAFGLTRSAKIDLVIEKGTEIGVSKFILYGSEKTLVEDMPVSRIERKLSRWRNIAESAAKQSLRTIVPEIAPPVHYNEIMAMAEDFDLALLADMSAQPTPVENYLCDSPRDILLLVGPESGLTDEETARALRAGFKAIKLGPRRLRTETAAIVLTSLVMHETGEL
jgi:16S rRNA (uracil1498-N3)-methyltransferase